jgi:[ribosomal protein S5]-alanine N-acetyltransferase
MTVSVREARSGRDRSWIEGVYRDYLDDLAPANATGLFPALGEVGHREPDQIAHWFADRNAYPLIILQLSDPVGFAMVARGSATPVQPRIDYRMAEFFITRERRRLGIGRTAVQLILNRFAGRWEIAEFQRNVSAVSFWRRVVMAYTHGVYQERVVNGEVRQIFESGPTVPGRA